MPTCYRHPRVETGVSCSNCGKYICPDCMTPTPVGMRCPDCARQKTKTRTMSSLHADPTLTYVLIAINVLMFIGESAGGSSFTGGAGGGVTSSLALNGLAVADGQWYRLITGGFLHAGLFHIAFNMYALLWLGRMLEPTLGHVRFGALYLASLVAGSFGVILLDPTANTVGASGAIFGLFGAVVALARSRGIDLRQTGLIPVLVLNLAITFLIPGISIGGHLGGLVGGFVFAYLIETLSARRLNEYVVGGITLGLTVLLAVGAVALAGAQTGL
jgi:membrane associated rhomboid family serine protease